MLGRLGYKIGKAIFTIPEPPVQDLTIPDFPEISRFKISDERLFIKSRTFDIPESLLSPTRISSNRLFTIPSLEMDSPLEVLQECEQIDYTTLFEDIPFVSNNLFNPIPTSLPNGRCYGDKDKEEETPKSLFGTLEEEPTSKGYRKAWRETKTQGGTATKSLSIWELIYPFLLPPLNLDFPQQIDFAEGCNPYPFQRFGIRWLTGHPGALLADETGTGKTVMASVALRLLFQQGKISKCLIACPLAALSVWDEHLQKWAPELQVTVVRGNKETRGLDWHYPAHIYLTTYDTVRSDFVRAIRKKPFVCPNPQCNTTLQVKKRFYIDDNNIPNYICPDCKTPLNNALPIKSSNLDIDSIKHFDLVLIDEAQNIKNPGSGRSKAVKIFSPGYRWALSATPFETKVDDLASIFEFVKPNYLRAEGLTTFRAKELIKPYTLRRTKKEVRPDMPDKIPTQIWLELDDEQREIYDAIENQEIRKLEELGEKVTRIHIFGVIQRLKQICNFHRHKETSPKTEALLNKLEEITASGKKVLVFSQYIGEGIEKISKILRQKQYGFVTYKGGISDKKREHIVDAFKNDPDITIFLGQVRAAGIALNLEKASYVIHFDHWWNPAVMWQAEDRAYRITREKDETLNVYSFWMKDTIERKIYDKLKERGLLFQEIFEGISEEMINELISTEEWLDILGVKIKKPKPAKETTKSATADLTIEEIMGRLETMPPLGFEELVKRLFNKLGFQNAKTTKRSHDGGVDIIASRTTLGGRERVVVQCKRTPKVGVGYARELLGVIATDPSIAKGYLVTNGLASSECKEFCGREGRLAYIDGPLLASYMKQFGIELGK